MDLANDSTQFRDPAIMVRPVTTTSLPRSAPPIIVLQRENIIGQFGKDQPLWKKKWYEKVVAMQSLYESSDENLVKSNSALTNDCLPVRLMRLRQVSKLSDNRPIIAIISSTRSKWLHQKNISDTHLVRTLIESVRRTVTDAEHAKWNIRLYVAVDDDDLYWVKRYRHIDLPDFLDLVFAMFPRKANRVPFTEIAQLAYKENAEYYCRVNDDTEFVTPEWISMAVDVLQNMTPPHLGVVGPSCKEGNTKIFTHDFVHRTHLEVFGEYYPRIFSNYYLDDWITMVYSPSIIGWNHSCLLESWVVKHHLSPTRYNPNFLSFAWLPFELERERRKILKFVQSRHPSLTSIIDEIGSRDPQIYLPDGLDPQFAKYVRENIPEHGNLLILEYNDEQSPYWHKISAGRVMFLTEKGNNATKLFYLDSSVVTYRDSWYESKPFCDEMIDWELPPSLNETSWDLILIPFNSTTDRKMQNLLMSYCVANKSTKILVVQKDAEELNNMTLLTQRWNLSDESPLVLGNLGGSINQIVVRYGVNRHNCILGHQQG